ncbi:chemotaxis protein CheR [Ectothiorhodospiraceae bacterium BW-2]|nr:chemotaxis protein CheR [Ectothiorhodospiraceae bacterium BW-2]
MDTELETKHSSTTSDDTSEVLVNEEPEPFSGYIVSIGASAGGLDALERFFSHCPSDSGAAFVVIQHLSPDHKSIMNNLLARHTRMGVSVAEEGMAITQNHLYLIPPGVVMRISRGRLLLTPKKPRQLTLPIDIFFTAMSEAYGSRSIGIILSGTGTDGTRGAVTINAAGGLLLAQNPDSAAFNGMPLSVIATGLVDAILPPEELPVRLMAHIQQQPYEESESLRLTIPYITMTEEELLAEIIQRLISVGGIDFSDYKPSTVMRRIERRMQIRRAPTLHQYLDLLESDTAELRTLRRDMLISVTNFFRDSEVFASLNAKVILPLVASCQVGETIRIWVAGTATGEEAYTLGMLFLEAFESQRRWPSLKIFATDVEQQCIDTAGSGHYPESAAAELSPERLERFFIRKGDSFVVKNELRQCIVFARHNLLSDPPFTRMDLVSCRNTLIYFRNGAQDRALRSLQYALRDGGALLLGISESLSGSEDGFETLSARHKLFRRIGSVMPPLPRYFTPSLSRQSALRPLTRHSVADQNELRPEERALSTLIKQFAPPALLIDENQEVVHLYGELGPYFRARSGSASLHINRILPEKLVPIATALLHKAFRDHCSLASDLIDLPLEEGRVERLRLSVHPCGSDESAQVLLCFEVAEQLQHPPPLVNINVEVETLGRIQTLEQELDATRESLQATIEELETSNEELQATNEELMASNEELQSANEELQSVNEEMSTVNAEFQEKVILLNRVNADLDGMAKAAGIATLFVDSELMITRYSPDATQIFKLREGDLGRPLDDISHRLDYPSLMADLRTTLNQRRMIEREVESLDEQQTWLVRLFPYQIPSSERLGAVATFIEVTAIHDARRLQAVLDALPQHIAVLGFDGRIEMVNSAWIRFAKANGDRELAHTGVGTNYLEVCQHSELMGDGDSSRAEWGIREVLEGSRPEFAMEYPCHSSGERRWFIMHAVPVRGEAFGAVVSHVNITDWYADEESHDKTES